MHTKTAEARSRSEIFRVNGDGTRACLHAAQQMGVQRLIHMSSIAVYGLPYDRRRCDEQTPTAPCGVAYNDSMYQAERILQKEAGDVDVTILRLCAVFGQFDRMQLPPLMSALQKRRFVYPGSPDRPYNLTSTAFIAEVVARLLELPLVAQRVETFIASDAEPPSYLAFIKAIADALEVPPPRLAPPVAALRIIGRAFDIADWLGYRPFLAMTSELVANVVIDAVFDGSALRNKLNLQASDSLEDVRKVVIALHERAAGPGR